jgi:hypothetical protein
MCRCVASERLGRVLARVLCLSSDMAECRASLRRCPVGLTFLSVDPRVGVGIAAAARGQRVVCR